MRSACASRSAPAARNRAPAARIRRWVAPKSQRVWVTLSVASVRCWGRERSMMLNGSLENSRESTR